MRYNIGASTHCTPATQPRGSQNAGLRRSRGSASTAMRSLFLCIKRESQTFASDPRNGSLTVSFLRRKQEERTIGIPRPSRELQGNGLFAIDFDDPGRSAVDEEIASWSLTSADDEIRLLSLLRFLASRLCFERHNAHLSLTPISWVSGEGQGIEPYFSEDRPSAVCHINYLPPHTHETLSRF